MPRTLPSILSNTVYDIPAWARYLIVLAGLAGVVIIVVASLVGNSEQTIPVDKLLHFGGYATLSTIFVMGLQPVYSFPVLALLALMSIGIEYLQPLNNRAFEYSDMAANLIGICTGFIVGNLLRLVGRWLATQTRQAYIRQQRRTYSTGSILLKQGSAVDKFMVIEKGEVQLSREVNGQKQTLGKMAKGEIIGLLGVIQNQPQFTTIEAVSPTTVYTLSLQDILENSNSSEEPVHLVLSALCRQVQHLAERITEKATPDGVA
ncbi:MAG: cyclic nucleotide-binding domain-containing protein [Gemmatales bacterium]